MLHSNSMNVFRRTPFASSWMVFCLVTAKLFIAVARAFNWQLYKKKSKTQTLVLAIGMQILLISRSDLESSNVILPINDQDGSR